MRFRYWLDRPAQDWEEALPIGNGRLGASVWGCVDNERITINEEGMWYGGRRERKNAQSRKYVDEIRKLLLEGKVEDAEFLCQMAMTSTPKYIRPYQMACDLNFLFFHRHEPIRAYRRQLDLDRAVAEVSYEVGDTVYTREFFVSAGYQVLAMRLTATGPDRLRFQFNINRRPFERFSGGNGTDSIYLKGQCGDGVEYYGSAVIGSHDGSSCQIGDYLAVQNATQAVIYFDCETSFSQKEPQKECAERLRKAVEAGYENIREAHRKEYGGLFNRMGLTLEKTDFWREPVSELLRRTQELPVRRYLTQLLFAFGRYLMICSSYRCRLPANLQGIWNGSYTPRWESKYTININLEMNYWMVDSCGLSECFQPFVELLGRIVENGRATAAEIYGCRGSVAHHNTDCYGNSDLEGLPASAYMWPMGEVWLSLHLYDHYLYTMDEAFLREVTLPVLEENIRFFYDFLYRSKDGSWLCGPSVSPENTYRTADGQIASITMAPAMDNEILWELCTDYLEGAGRVGKTGETVLMASEILRHLPAIALTEDGRIREWHQDYEETEKGHRHISHLFALYPGNQIHRETPKLLQAAKRTLQTRLENGGGHTGWSRAWLICMFARLGDGRSVGENIRLFLEKSTKENLYDSHPPFQIDGNFGFCAGVVEALAQREGRDIYLLSAAPEEWEDGAVRGLRLKGGLELDMVWEGKKLSYSLKSSVSQTVTVHYGQLSHEAAVTPDRVAEGIFEKEMN